MQTIIKQRQRYCALISNAANFQQLHYKNTYRHKYFKSESSNNKSQSNNTYFATLLLSVPIFAGFSLMKSQSAMAEEDSKEPKVDADQKPTKQEETPESMLENSIMQDITNENLKEVLASKENKFIYFYKGSSLNVEEFKKVEEYSQKIYNGLKVFPFKLDITKYHEEFLTYLKERNPNTADQAEEQIRTHSFLLANQYDDIWFWELDLINYFYGELLEQIFNFYQGPLKLMSEEQLVMNQSLENDFHVVVYVDDFNNEESMKKLKNFRKFNTKNTDKFFHFKYWAVQDKDLATKLKINTEEDMGNVYLIRQSSVFNQNKKNINLCGYDFYSEKFLSSDEISKDIAGSYSKILQQAFNSPIIVNDYMQFATLSQKFKTNMFVIYCDKKNEAKYNQILKAMVRARKDLPINLKPDESGMLSKSQRQQDVIFVLSSVRNLMPVVRLHEDKPQAIFVCTDENFINLFNTYLSSVEKVEGMTPDEYMKKALNNEQEFAYAKTDDDKEQNKKDTLKLIYSPDRFIMPKMFHSEEEETLINYQQMVTFVKSAINGERPFYWETEKIPSQKYSLKVVGEDFDKRILESKKDALVLVYHPIKEKNRQLMEQFEEFVRVEGLNRKDIVFARYNGINESSNFKSPQKLPAILYFKNNEGGQKEVINYKGINELLLKNAEEENIQSKIRQFMAQKQ